MSKALKNKVKLNDITVSVKDFGTIGNSTTGDDAVFQAAQQSPITDFLDAYVKDDQAALKAYKDQCLAVKKKYPNPSKKSKK